MTDTIDQAISYSQTITPACIMSDITPEMLATIQILEVIEDLIERAPTEALESILQETWLKISDTFPEDFQIATQDDAGAEGLRRYLRVKAFFEDPIANPISPEELADYYRHQLPIEEP
jgi:hypothetical protein